MAKITSVEPQKKSASRRTKRFNIFLDGEFAFGVDEDLVVNRRLVVGKVINPEDLQKILFEAEVGKLMERMYRLFSLRQRSEKEVRDYFRIKNLESRIKEKEEKSQVTIDALVEVLKKKGLLNDLEFAKAWTEARRKSKQKGIKAIKAELFQKGIDKEIIEEVTRLQGTGYSEEELAKQALEKKMKHWKNLPSIEFRKKAFEFLMRKGFEYDVVKEVVEKAANFM
ncbi:MAG: RecX family transcriptional regulator [Candidatus Daviesbacteria bacterium]|nr:RecX family transcriptional regulator [Candidatus Daviesbacteria bacterium]